MKVNVIFPEAIYVRGHSEHLSWADKAATVRQLGLTHVLNLWTRIDRDLATLVPNYIHAPMPDGHSVPPWLLDTALGLAQAITRDHARVLIQCHAGRNRSGLAAAAVLWGISGMSGSDCLEYVRRWRPGAVDNDDFETWLDMLPAHQLGDAL